MPDEPIHISANSLLLTILKLCLWFGIQVPSFHSLFNFLSSASCSNWIIRCNLSVLTVCSPFRAFSSSPLWARANFLLPPVKGLASWHMWDYLTSLKVAVIVMLLSYFVRKIGLLMVNFFCFSPLTGEFKNFIVIRPNCCDQQVKRNNDPRLEFMTSSH